MKYLFFDTETTGFPPKARLVSIAWQLWDEENLIEKKHHIIRPDGFDIPLQASNIHGITTEMAIEKGEDVEKIINLFLEKIDETDAIIAHNFRFDSQIISGELTRLNKKNSLKTKKVYDTMLDSTNYLKLKGKNGKYKWPNLNELHTHLFNKKFDNAHSADADVDATVKCFFELKKRGVIN